MAGQNESRRSVWLLLFVSLMVQTVEFELTQEDWEELPASLTSLHSLRGLHQQITHEATPDTHIPLLRAAVFLGRAGAAGRQLSDRVLHHEKTEKDIFEDLRDCEDLSECVLQKQQDFKGFLAHVEGQKLQDTLLSASDLSYYYRNKILLMMDEEAETLQRAEEEHLEDPVGSMKVGQACIDKGSCLMKVHKDTVVRIFGRTTGDGSRLSDYSGTALATTLLQTELKMASLFSINGNTSMSFQKNFMRVFRTHGLSAVLETNKNDYQILDQADLVVKYTPRVSQRGMDHTTQYDAQSILIMEDNQVVRQAATFLYEKHPAVTSVFMLDQNGRPKLIKGDPLRLTPESRLVLVGHGRKGNDGEMRLAGYQAKDVAEIVSRMDSVGGEIKTTSIVACEVGSDESFISTLLNELHARSIDTEVHLRSSILEVSHSGEKVTVELTPSGLVRRHKDDTSKVIAWRNEDGKIVTRVQSNSRGREVFSNENNFLGGGVSPKTQPAEPTRCVHEDARQHHTDILEGLAWAFFADRGGPDLIKQLRRPVISNDFEYVLMVQQENTDVRWLDTRRGFEGNEGNNNQDTEGKLEPKTVLEDVLNHCYEIKSADDVLNLIAHYANFGETESSYIMLHDWIFKIDPKFIYIYPAGKRLNNNEKDDQNRVQNIKDSLEEQVGKHEYKFMFQAISEKGEPGYGRYARETLNGQYEMRLPSSTEAWYSTYFIASVMSESARNFRTFPVIAMALSTCDQNGQLTVEGLEFLLGKHPMTQGGTWFHPGRRGFYGSSDVLPVLREKENKQFRRTLKKLQQLIMREDQVYNEWHANLEKNLGMTNMDFADMATNLLQHVYGNENLQNNPDILRRFNEATKQFSDAVTTQQANQGFSGALGGSADGRVTDRDLHAYANVEQSVMLSSHYTRSSAVLSENIQVHLQKQFGKSLKDFVVKPDSIKMKDGDCYFEVVSKTNLDEKYSSKVQLPEEARQHMENIKKSMQSISEVDDPAAGKVRKDSDHLHRTGIALGVMGLMVGAQGAVRSFERGDIEHGVMGTLQTAHGVTGLSMAALGKQLAVTKNMKVFRAINTILRNPVSKVAMRAMPLVGIGFGIYSVYEDLKRGDALGYIDAGIDSLMIALDVLELAVPELAPIIVPLNLAISAVRMLFDDVYLSIQSELNNLPPDAGVLDKIGAFFRGLGKGFLHFALDILSFFYTIPHREIEEGRRLVEQISDYRKYFSIREVQAGRKAIDFTGGDMSMSGGGITFCLSDHGSSTFCMDNFVSSERTIGPKCWTINTDSTKDIILGIGESHRLQYSTIQLKVLLFIPAGSMNVVSGYEAIPNTRYGTYNGNNLDNNFFSVQNDKDEHVMELLLSYYYKLYGKNGDDTFFLGPQRSYVEGQGGRDTYIIPSHGGSTVINNYDPVKTMDLLVLHVSYRQLSVRKSGNDVILSFLNDHNVRILNWFVGEEYRHMNMMSEDSISFDISNVVVSSVKLIAQSVNMMSKTEGQIVDASRPPLNTVINILGSAHSDQLTGNSENNLIDGGGGRLDTLRGKEGEDAYIIKKQAHSAVFIDNYSSDNKQDMMILEAKIRDIKVRVNGDHLILIAFADQSCSVTLLNWFRSEADRHLVILTEDFITFTFSADRPSCTRSDPFISKCILIQVLDYTKSKHPLQVDLEGDEVYQSVTQVRGSDGDDNIKGNGQQNIIIPGKGTDSLQGRGGEDWYIITPGTGLKTIDNYSPDLVEDKLYIKEKYEFIRCKCDGADLQVLVNGTQQVILKGWFGSVISQHLQILSSDQVIFNLPSSTAICQLITSLTNDKTFQTQMDSKMLNAMSAAMVKVDVRQSELITPCLYDVDETHEELEVMCHATPSGTVFRSSFAGQEKFQDHGCPYADQPLFSSGSMSRKNEVYIMVCRYMLNLKYPHTVDNRQKGRASPMIMNTREFVSVIELFGSSGFDEMTGNAKDNTLDPYTGGGLMVGLDGKDTYVVKSEYGTNVEIDNLSKDLREDTVLFEADFFSGLITVLSEGYNVLISAKAKGHDIQVRLLNYHLGKQHQHLSFLTSDGVHFRLGYLNEESLESLLIKAYKIKLDDEQTDCRIDLSAHANLSAVHTVQGCPQRSNNIEGNGLDNALTGGVKVDALDGGPGHDTLMGGQGNDILLGGSGDDTIYGEEGDDTMMGGPGYDAFIPGPGVDLVDGGTGRDTVFYQGDHSQGEGVYVNLLTGECRQADAEGDVLKDIENVVGTIYSDILVSGYEPALLKGSDGNDVLVSLAGQDYLIGGDGSDVYLMVVPQDAIIIDNCADDNATDVLYLPSMSADSVHCTRTNTSLTLSFSHEAKSFQVELKDWISSSDTCRHLLLILRDGKTTVEDLQLTCKANAGE